MKIDNHSHFNPAVQTERTESPKRATTAESGRVGSKGTDAVTLSSDAQLAAKAVAAAGQSDDVRADEVTRAKKLLAGGDLGKNADRLADAIIERVIQTD
jgi:flagellar biosynthesis anti-sigma factor FlgM